MFLVSGSGICASGFGFRVSGYECPVLGYNLPNNKNFSYIVKSESVRAGQGIGGPFHGLALGLRKGQAQTHMSWKKMGLTISPTTKIFRPRKIQLTRKDVDMNSSCPPLAPR